MTSLPERLRSLALRDEDSMASNAMREAADELDRRAERILKLEYDLRVITQRASLALVPVVAEGEPLPPLDPEQPNLGPADDKEKRPGVTLTEDPTKLPTVVTDWLGVAEPELHLPPGWNVFCHPDGTVTLRRG